MEVYAEWAPWIVNICEALYTLPTNQPIFNFGYQEAALEFRRSCTKVGVQAVLYQARHSGPSIDLARGTRDRATVKARGRWAADASVNRYERATRLSETFQKLPAARRLQALECEHRLADVFSGRASPVLMLRAH